MCPDGLVFDASLSPKVEQCNYPFIVPCPENSVLRKQTLSLKSESKLLIDWNDMISEPAQPSGIECPRQNGYFEHEDPANCADYYECTGGIPVKRTCATGLVFDEFTGTCQWAHTGIRVGCGQRKRKKER